MSPDELCQALVRNIDRLATTKLTIAGARELGLFGMSIPERYGGAGFDLDAICTCIRALARHDRGLATTIGLHVGLGTRPLIAFGSEEAHEEWLPRLATGEQIAAFAATEPNAGSDIASIRTTATFDECAASSRALTLNGEKAFITNGGIAQVFTVLARTPGLGRGGAGSGLAGRRNSQSMLVVTRGDRGVSTGREEAKLGLTGSSTTAVSFEDVSLPLDRILGEPGRGEEQLMSALAFGRTVMAAGCAGLADAALARALDHVKKRVQFGRTLASMDIVREQIADMAARRFMIVALVRHAAAAAASSTASAAASSEDKDENELTRRSLATKVLASEAAWDVVDVALQLHGGSGYLETSGLPLLLRDARVLRIFEGANDVLLLRAGAIEAASPLRRRDLSSQNDELAERANRIATAVARFRLELISDPQLGRRPTDVHRLGRAAAIRESADAVVLQLQRQDGSPTELDSLSAARWLGQAEKMIEDVTTTRPSLGSRADLITLTDLLYLK